MKKLGRHVESRTLPFSVPSNSKLNVVTRQTVTCLQRKHTLHGMRLPKQSGSFAILLSLTENADQQQKKEFLDELELMKPMVPHPNIVGLVGCCTKSGEWRELKYMEWRLILFVEKTIFYPRKKNRVSLARLNVQAP